MTDETTILISIAVTNADLQSAYELAGAMGEEEAASSFLIVAPFTHDALIDLSARLFAVVEDAGLLDKNGKGPARLIAGTVSKLGICNKREREATA